MNKLVAMTKVEIGVKPCPFKPLRRIGKGYERTGVYKVLGLNNVKVDYGVKTPPTFCLVCHENSVCKEMKKYGKV
jgi:hypothetical protein